MFCPPLSQSLWSVLREDEVIISNQVFVIYSSDCDCVIINVCSRNIQDNYFPCRDHVKAASPRECERQKVLGQRCCYKEVAGVGNCWVDGYSLERKVGDSPKNQISDWSQSAPKPVEPLPGESVRNALKASRNLEATDQVRSLVVYHDSRNYSFSLA